MTKKAYLVTTTEEHAVRVVWRCLATSPAKAVQAFHHGQRVLVEEDKPVVVDITVESVEEEEECK